jgi:hypothetical protein
LGILAVGFVGFGAPARAATTDTLQFTVGILDADPPAAIDPLTATASVTPGQVVLDWLAPDEDGVGLNGEAVQTYLVRYATYSIADVGSAAAWWAAATPEPFVGVPQVPGQPELMVLSLAEGTRYYFAVRSIDISGNLSPLDNTVPQANALTRSSDAEAPVAVAGLRSTAVGPDFVVTWAAVTRNMDGSPAADIVGYRVYSSTSLFGFETSSATVGFVPEGARSVSLPRSTDLYYLIRAVDSAGNESPVSVSNFIRVTAPDNIAFGARDNTGSVGEAFLDAALLAELARSGSDYLLNVAPDATPALSTGPWNRGTYRVALAAPDGTVTGLTGAFGRPDMTVVLEYSVQPGDDPADVGVFWWNGSRWIKLGRTSVASGAAPRTVTFQAAFPGVYQVRNYATPDDLSLDRASVVPRVFTPNGDGINDAVYFYLENPRQSALDGWVIDVAGAEVSRLRPAGDTAARNVLMWDGRDASGHRVSAGVYIYKIRGEGKTFSGSVVVAK